MVLAQRMMPPLRLSATPPTAATAALGGSDRRWHAVGLVPGSGYRWGTGLEALVVSAAQSIAIARMKWKSTGMSADVMFWPFVPVYSRNSGRHAQAVAAALPRRAREGEGRWRRCRQGQR